MNDRDKEALQEMIVWWQMRYGVPDDVGERSDRWRTLTVRIPKQLYLDLEMIAKARKITIDQVARTRLAAG